jgi:hypothetical protein
MSDLSIQEIAPGVNAALGGICNRGLISQGESVLVVDSGIAVAEATPLRAAAQQRQKLAPRGNEEHLPNVIGQAFDELSRA